VDESIQSTVVFSGGGTGGHLYPALALAEAMVSLDPRIRPFFVGAERGLEARVLPERGLAHRLVPVHGIDRRSLLRSLSAIGGVARAVPALGRLFLELRPELVVLTGGYAAAPAGVTAALMGIPLVLQEQNSVPGITTRMLARMADRIHVAFPEAAERLPRSVSSRIRRSGNPIPTPMEVDRAEARALFGLAPASRAVMVIGGSQGSRALNAATLALVEEVSRGQSAWPDDAELLWSTGPTNHATVLSALEALGSPPWIRTFGFIDRIQEAMRACDIAISRAGAMTTAEIICAGLPSILVPLPTSAADHQTGNARSLERAGAARFVPEDGLTGAALLAELSALLADPATLAEMRSAALSVADPYAARHIAIDLLTWLPAVRS